MGLHNDFSWHYTKAPLPASSEQGAHAAAQLCWSGFQGEARKCSFLGRNPSRYHFKTKHSLASKLRKSLCIEFWRLSKRCSQNFEFSLVFPLWTKQQYILVSSSTGQTDDVQANAQPKWLFKAFSFCAATAWCRCPSDPTQMSLWPHSVFIGTTAHGEPALFRHRGEAERGVVVWSLPPTLPLPSFAPLRNSILSTIFPIREINQTKTFPACLSPSVFLDSGFLHFFRCIIWCNLSEVIFHSSYTLLFNALKAIL